MKRLGYYLSSQVFAAVLFSLFSLLALFIFFDFISEVARISKGAYQFKNAIFHIILLIPGHLYRLMPTSVLIGGIFALSSLAGRSELTVMRTSGIGLVRILKWLLVCGTVFALFTAAVGEFLAPISLRAAGRYMLKASNSVLLGDLKSGIWVKDDHQIINITAILPDLTLEQVRIYKFGQDQELKEIIDAETGHYQNINKWELEQVIHTQFQSNSVKLTHSPTLLWESSINTDTLSVLMIKPQEMSINSLNSYIAHLKKNDGDVHRYELARWIKLIYPFSCIGMLLISLPFALGQTRSVRVGLRVFFGILLGLAFNFSNQTLGYIGVVYYLPAWFSVGMPTFALFLTALSIVWYKERVRFAFLFFGRKINK